MLAPEASFYKASKMITIQKNRLLFAYLFLLLTSLPAYALHSVSEQSVHPDNTSMFKTSISAQFGMINGLLNENVFSTDLLISQLNWTMDYVFFVGAGVTIQFLKMFYLNVGYWSGLNREIGYITDSDYNTDGTLSDFSRHYNTLQKIYFFDANAGFTFKIFNPLSVTAMIGYNSQNAKMAARNGYLQYPAGATRKAFYGTGLSNEVTYYIPYFGLGANLEIADLLYFQFFPMYSPIVYCDGVDYHYRREIDFYTRITSGEFFSLMVAAGWKLTKNASLVFSVQYTSIVMGKGESYYIFLPGGERSAVSPRTASSAFRGTSFTIAIEHTLKWI